MLGEAVLGFVGDVEVSVVAALDDLKPELRDIDHRVVTGTAEAALPPLVGHGIVDDVVLLHVLPRRVAVEGGAAGAGPDRRGGLGGDVHGNVVVGVVALGQAGQGGGAAGLVPADAEHLGKLHGDIHRLIGRGVVVGAGRDLDGDDGGAGRLAGDGDDRPAHAHRGHPRGAGFGGDRAVARAGDVDGAGLCAVRQGEGGLVEGEAACGLADAPAYRPGRRGTVRPLVIGGRRECGVVAAGIGARGVPAQGHLRGVIPRPGGALRLAGIGQTAGLGWGRGDGGPSDGPHHRLGLGRPIRPAVIARRGEGGGVAAGSGRALLPADGELGSIVVVPGGSLGLAGVGEAAVLGRNPGNGRPVDRPGHFLGRGGVIRPLVALLRGKGGRIGAGICPGRDAAQRQRLGVVVVPAGGLLAAGIGQRPVLRGDGADGVYQVGHGFQGRVCGLLGILCRSRGLTRCAGRAVCGVERGADSGLHGGAVGQLHLCGGYLVRIVGVEQVVVNVFHALHTFLLGVRENAVLVSDLVHIGHRGLVLIDCHELSPPFFTPSGRCRR